MSDVQYGMLVEKGNGYRCSCCRQTWEELLEYDTFEDLMEAIADIEFAKKNYDRLYKLSGSRWDDEDDVEILRIFKFEDLERNEDLIKAHLQKRLENLEKSEIEKVHRSEAAKKSAATKRAANKRKRYLKLKAEFEGGEL